MIIFWNVRHLNSFNKQMRLYDIIKEFKSSLVCLLERHVLQEKQKKVIERIFSDSQYVDNYEHNRLGRI